MSFSFGKKRILLLLKMLFFGSLPASKMVVGSKLPSIFGGT